MSLEKLSVLMKANSNMEISTIISYMIITFVLTAVIFFVYKLTYSGVAYSHNFNVSIVLTGMITAMIMMVIGNNLALSLGMVGALSIVRFRAAIKEPKDISFLFWSISVGLSAGTGAIMIAITGTVCLTLTILIYQMSFLKTQTAYLLIIKGERFDSDEALGKVTKFVNKYRLRMKNTGKESSEVIYEVRLKDENETKLIDALYEVEGINQVNIVSFDGHLNE